MPLAANIIVYDAVGYSFCRGLINEFERHVISLRRGSRYSCTNFSVIEYENDTSKGAGTAAQTF